MSKVDQYLKATNTKPLKPGPAILPGMEFGKAFCQHFGLPADQVDCDLQLRTGGDYIFSAVVQVVMTADDLAAIADLMPGRTKA